MKIYMKPAIEIIGVETNQILAGSPLNIGDGGGSSELRDDEVDGVGLSREFD